jgi:hypothetical protein
MRHYRCYRVWAWNANAKQVSDTLVWFPTATVMPRHSSTDIVMAATHDLARALLHPAPSSPLSPLTGSQRHRLIQLADIFQQHTHRPDHIPSEPPAVSLSLVPPPNPFPIHDPDSVTLITPSPTLTDTPTTHPIARVVPFPSRWGRTRTRVPTMPHCTTPPTMNPASLPRVVPTLVPPIRAAAQSPSLSAAPASPPQKRITWANSVTGGIAPIATYQSATINPGIRRRRATKAQKLAADRAAFLSASITIHPGLTSISWGKRRPASRRIHRRKRGRQLPTPQSNHTQSRPNRAHIVIHHQLANLAAKITKTAAHFHSAFTVIDADTGKSYEHAQLIRGENKKEWLYSTANEFGRLTDGVKPHTLSGSKTMRYIPHHALPPGRQATHSGFVATERPYKAKTKRVRLAVGGNLFHYPDKFSTPTSDLSTFNMLLNSVISTPGALFATFDLKDFYLGTPIKRKEYMRIPISSIPPSIIEQYHLLDLVHNDFVLVEISRGMYGLSQAGILAYDQLVRHLSAHGYAPCTHTPGITFCLVVDDFRIKYTNKTDAMHLLTALQQLYVVTADWSGSLYLGMTLT